MIATQLIQIFLFVSALGLWPLAAAEDEGIEWVSLNKKVNKIAADVSQLKLDTFMLALRQDELEIRERSSSGDTGPPSRPRNTQHEPTSGGGEPVLVVLGGEQGKSGLSPTNAVQYYDFRRAQWGFLPPLSSARYSLSAVTARGRLFAIGGYPSGEGQHFEMYDPRTRDRAWSLLAPLPQGHCDAAVFTDRNESHVYVISGYGTRSFEVYNLATGFWKTFYHHYADLRNIQAALVQDRYIYIFGGSGTEYILRYDTHTNSMNSLKTQINRENYGLVKVASSPIDPTGPGVECVYLIGGKSYDQTTDSVLRWCYQSRPTRDGNGTLLYTAGEPEFEWVPPMSVPRQGAAVAAHGGYIYVTGGRDQHGNTLDSVEVFDVKAQRWSRTAVPAMNYRVAFAGAAILYI